MRETDPTALADVDGNEAVDHARQLRDALTLADCQPAVGAFFNFLLTDELADLADWQSGLLWADGTPKGSFATFAETARAVGAGRVDCAAPKHLAIATREQSATRTQATATEAGITVDATVVPSSVRPLSVTRPGPVVRVAPSVRAAIVRRIGQLFRRGVAQLEIRASARKQGWYLADGFERRTQRPVAVWFRTRYGRLVGVAVAKTVPQLRGPAAAPCDLKPAFGRRPRC